MVSKDAPSGGDSAGEPSVTAAAAGEKSGTDPVRFHGPREFIGHGLHHRIVARGADGPQGQNPPGRGDRGENDRGPRGHHRSFRSPARDARGFGRSRAPAGWEAAPVTSPSSAP